ncbi:hypothetical protein F5882DRAFT_383767 [Hyaloscypha sp. PMI_1271]|nr:hypothetical protein F5882DRAFT_383767 [Hyaloscypha sp. PMI_1271]
MRLWALDASATLVKICPASVEVRPGRGTMTPTVRFVKWAVVQGCRAHVHAEHHPSPGRWPRGAFGFSLVLNQTGYHLVFAERRPPPQATPDLQEAWRPSIVGGRAGTGQGRAGVMGDMLCSARRVQTLFQMHGVGGRDGEDTPQHHFLRLESIYIEVSVCRRSWSWSWSWGGSGGQAAASAQMSDNSSPGEYDVARPGLDKQPRQGHITNKESQRRRDRRAEWLWQEGGWR